MDRPQKIRFGEMRESGVRGLLIYCADYHCSHSIAISGDQWPDDVGLSDIEGRFVCNACGERGADVRPELQRGQEVPRLLLTFRVHFLLSQHSAGLSVDEMQPGTGRTDDGLVAFARPTRVVVVQPMLDAYVGHRTFE
jgi:hypothetical protein